MSLRTSYEKLRGPKVVGRGSLEWIQVDSVVNESLYDEIEGDDLAIPSGVLLTLVGGDSAGTRIGNGKVWSECEEFPVPEDGGDEGDEEEEESEPE